MFHSPWPIRIRVLKFKWCYYVNYRVFLVVLSQLKIDVCICIFIFACNTYLYTFVYIYIYIDVLYIHIYMYVDIIALSLKSHRMLSRFWKQPAFKEWNLDSKALQPNNDIHDFTLVIDKHPSNKVDVAFSQCRMHSRLFLITLWSTVIYTVSGLSWFPWSTHWGLHWRYTLENLDSSVCVVFWGCG